MCFGVGKVGALFFICLVHKSRAGHLMQVRISIPLSALANFFYTHPVINSSFLNMAFQNCRQISTELFLVVRLY